MKEFEQEFIPKVVNKQQHHEEGFCTQKTVKEQAQNLVHTINEMGNPFLDDIPELLILGDVIDESVVKTVCTVEALGEEQYKSLS